jgi:hypothetical protein
MVLTGIAIFLRSHIVKDKNIIKGVIMYPGDRGIFKSEEAKKRYQDLFEGKAPFLPYHGVGQRYAETKFSEAELRNAKLEHMKRKFSAPKIVDDTFWKEDEIAFHQLVYPLGVVRGGIDGDESPISCAIRELWEETGIRADPEELKPIGQARQTQVYEMYVSMDRAKWDWMTHQAERVTLTDWDKCPHSGVLDYLGVSRKVKAAYCETHGGPILVSDINEKLVEKATKSIMETCGMSL